MVTLSMVKSNKKKDRPTSVRGTEDATLTHDNTKKWTTEKCKVISRSVDAPLGGDIEALRQRCILLQKLQAVQLGSVLGLKIDDARKLCDQLDLTLGTKVDMVERIARTPNSRQEHDALLSALREG
ncbi:hypothetical protein SARC_05358 [Sphaeroforma arctica JP610]|uniref:Uncharacterized protein n=1 Tax=Sphaeroforma arctica JP610 TaxID=667725 RepID=A0A0L0FZW6_9EUKA|nr:hypothetical protein SARC_05358 [Sphaeroforma arctica JP610]KNC82365.1 hypothetical protein SARC_05358 [Sphaeroforma arctica JP610]|eukprot:XP_014156267.1 hypothetical protein SARC_05358 [Sphaeroforma arctica JP610]